MIWVYTFRLNKDFMGKRCFLCNYYFISKCFELDNPPIIYQRALEAYNMYCISEVTFNVCFIRYS